MLKDIKQFGKERLMHKYKIFRDETYIYYVEANSWEEAQEIADDAPMGEGELISVHNEVMEKKEND